MGGLFVVLGGWLVLLFIGLLFLLRGGGGGGATLRNKRDKRCNYLTKFAVCVSGLPILCDYFVHPIWNPGYGAEVTKAAPRWE